MLHGEVLGELHGEVRGELHAELFSEVWVRYKVGRGCVKW